MITTQSPTFMRTAMGVNQTQRGRLHRYRHVAERKCAGRQRKRRRLFHRADKISRQHTHTHTNIIGNPSYLLSFNGQSSSTVAPFPDDPWPESGNNSGSRSSHSPSNSIVEMADPIGRAQNESTTDISLLETCGITIEKPLDFLWSVLWFIYRRVSADRNQFLSVLRTWIQIFRVLFIILVVRVLQHMYKQIKHSIGISDDQNFANHRYSPQRFNLITSIEIGHRPLSWSHLTDVMADRLINFPQSEVFFLLT